MKYKTIPIDRKKMQVAMLDSVEKGVMTEELGKYIMTLTENIMRSTLFKFEHWQRDMFEEFYSKVLMQCVYKMDKYDVNKSDAFAFYNTVIINYLRDLFKVLTSKDYLGANIRIYIEVNGEVKLSKAKFVRLNENVYG